MLTENEWRKFPDERLIFVKLDRNGGKGMKKGRLLMLRKTNFWDRIIMNINSPQSNFGLFFLMGFNLQFSNPRNFVARMPHCIIFVSDGWI